MRWLQDRLKPAELNITMVLRNGETVSCVAVKGARDAEGDTSYLARSPIDLAQVSSIWIDVFPAHSGITWEAAGPAKARRR